MGAYHHQKRPCCFLQAVDGLRGLSWREGTDSDPEGLGAVLASPGLRVWAGQAPRPTAATAFSAEKEGLAVESAQ